MRFPRPLKGMPSTHRVLVGGVFVIAVGLGMYAAASVVFFTRDLNLSAGKVGIVLSVAGIMSFISAIPFGHLSDHIGARRATLTLQLCYGVLVAALVIVRSFIPLIVVVGLLGAVSRGNQVSRQALVADVVSEDERVKVQALSRSAANVGFSLGALFAAPVIASSTHAAFTALLLGVAACYFIVSQVTARLPETRHLRKTSGPIRSARPPAAFVMLGLVTGYLALHASILDVALPLWILHDTRAPRILVSAMMLANTLMVVLLQVRASRLTQSVRSAARVLTASGVVLAISCVIYASTHDLGVWPAIGLLLLATVMLTVGEMLHSTASWTLSFGLSPSHGLGRHLAAFSLGAAMQDAFGPALVTFLVIEHPDDGWLALGVSFVVAAAIAVPLAQRAQRQHAALLDTHVPVSTIGESS
jgi:MFS family permease